MNAITKEQSTALSIPERAAVALASPDHEVKLRELVKASAGILTVTNKAGREECHSAYMTLKNTRVAINHKVEEVTEDAKAFTKGVKDEARRLVGISAAEEDRLQKLRDDWDAAEQARKEALIAAERARVEAHQKAIQALRDMPLQAVGKTSAEISAIIGGMVGAEPGETFEEFLDEAKLARFEALEKLAAAEAAQRNIEIEAESRRQEEARAAAEAEERRIAEAERLAAERAENARVAAENARIAAEHEAERQRLAKVAAEQQAAAQAAQKAIDDAAKAETARQAAAAAEAQAKLDARQRELDERQAAADARDAEAELVRQREAAHPEALMMNAEFDVAREAERERLSAELAAKTPTPVDESLLEVVDATFDEALSDGEIIGTVMEVFGLSQAEAIDRLQAIDFDAARAGLQ